MAFVATDKDGAEFVYAIKPVRSHSSRGIWYGWNTGIQLPKGSIRKLIGRELTWEDEPVELKGE